MRNASLLAAAIVVGTLGLFGCSHTTYVQQPVAQAPPVNGGGIPVASGAPVAPGSAGVFQWQEVPAGQQVPVARAIFDQGGYQIYAQSGETIVVPFANQNLYVMRFGRSTTGQPYFVNETDAPVLYLPPSFALENSANANARWYPLPADYAYTRPVYVSLAPSWNDYIGMNWYSGMNYYGGMWGYSPHAAFVWMPNYYVNIGGTRYTSYNAYRSYYVGHPGIRYTYNTTIYNTRSTGSFGRSTGSFGRSSGSTGSFNSGRTSSFGGGSFNTGRSTGTTGSFNSGRTSGGTGSFSGGRSFGGGSTSGSFGGGSPTIRNTSPSSTGSSFGGSRSTGSGSFGGGSSSGGRSFGGGSSTFGGGRSSGGGSFGGGRSSGGSFGRKR